MSVAMLSPGQAIETTDQVSSLPIGSIIEVVSAPHITYTKIENNLWQGSDGYNHADNAFTLSGYNRVKSLGTKAVILPSLLGWQYRWIDNAWWSAEQAGVAARTVETAMERLRLDYDAFPVGAGLEFRSSHERNRCPSDTLLYVGDPAKAKEFGLFVMRQGDSPRHVLGLVNGWNGARLTVARVPNDTEATWFTASGTEEEQEQIAEFKARAWRIGWKIKQQHGWCSSYESYMRQVGLDETSLRGVKHSGISPGDRIAPDVAADLPVGTVLRWTSNNHAERWQWFIRDDGAGNLAKTRLLFGTATEHRNYRSSMEVLVLGDDPMDLACPISRDEAQALPPGSVLTFGADKFVVCHDQRIAYDQDAYHVDNPHPIPQQGTWNIRDFGANAELVSVG